MTVAASSSSNNNSLSSQEEDGTSTAHSSSNNNHNHNKRSFDNDGNKEEEEEEEDLIGLLDALAEGKATIYHNVTRGGGGGRRSNSQKSTGRLVLTETRMAFFPNTTTSAENATATSNDTVGTPSSDFKVRWNSIAKQQTSCANPQTPKLRLLNHQGKTLKFTLRTVDDVKRIKADIKQRLKVSREQEQQEQTNNNAMSRFITKTLQQGNDNGSDDGVASEWDALKLLQDLLLVAPSKACSSSSSLVVACIHNKKQQQPAGLQLGINATTQRLCIVDIDRTNGLFQDTPALQPDMEVLWINDTNCCSSNTHRMSSTEAATLILETSGTLLVVARQPPPQRQRRRHPQTKQQQQEEYAPQKTTPLEE